MTTYFGSFESSEGAKRWERLLLHDDQWRAYGDIAVMIQQVRKSETLEDYRNLQIALGAHIMHVNAQVGAAKRRHSQASSMLNKRRKTPISAGEIAALEAQSEQTEFEWHMYRKIYREYCTVGDAIAWQLYDFRELPIFAAGRNQSPGIIANKAGASAEEETIETLWREQRAFGLRHDFTNCLRIADISIFSPGHSHDGKLYEVKSGDASATPRQKRRQEGVERLQKYDATVTSDRGMLIHHRVEKSGSDPRTNLSLLQEAVVASREQGIGFAATSYLAVTVVNFFHPHVQRPDEAMKMRIAQFRVTPAAITSPPCADYLYAYSYGSMPGLDCPVPFTVYPLFPADVSALVCGYLLVRFELNTAAVTEAFRGRGYTADCLLGKSGQPPGAYFRVAQRETTILINQPAVMSLLFAGLALEDLVGSVIESLERSRTNKAVRVSGLILPAGTVTVRGTRTSAVVPTFGDLEEVWRASRLFVEDEGNTHPNDDSDDENDEAIDVS